MLLLLVGITLLKGEIVYLAGEIVAVEAGGAGSTVRLWRGFGAEEGGDDSGGGGLRTEEAEFGVGGGRSGEVVR